MALNLPFTKVTVRHNSTKIVNEFQYAGLEKMVQHHVEDQGEIKTKVGMPWCRGRFLSFFFSERSNTGGHRCLIRKSIPNSVGIKRKAITTLPDRFLSRWVTLWCNKEITNTLRLVL